MKHPLTLILELILILLTINEITYLGFSNHQLLWLRIDIYTYKTYNKCIAIRNNTIVQIGHYMNATYITSISTNGNVLLINTSSSNGKIVVFSTKRGYVLLHKGKCTVYFTGTGTISILSKEYDCVKHFYVPIDGDEAYFEIDEKDLPNAKIFLVVLGFEGVTNKVISSIIHNGIPLGNRQNMYLLGTLMAFLANRTNITGSYRVRLIQVPYMIPPVYYLKESKYVWHYEGFMKELHISVAQLMNSTIMNDVTALHLVAFIVPANSSLNINAPHIRLYSNVTKAIFFTKYEDILVFPSKELVIRSNTMVYVNISINAIYFSNNSNTIVIRYPENYEVKWIKAEVLCISPFAIVAKGVSVHLKPRTRLLRISIVDYSEKPISKIDAVVSMYDLLSSNKSELSLYSFPSDINITTGQILHIVGYSNFTQVLNYTVMSPPPNVMLTASLCEVLLEIRDHEDKLVRGVNVYITGPKQVGPLTINTLCQNGSLYIRRMPIGHYTVIVLMNGTELTRDVLNVTRPGLYVIRVPLFSLKIKVLNTRGLPVKNAVVIMHNKNFFFKGKTDIKGEVTIDEVMPNSYTLRIIWMNKTVYSNMVVVAMGKDLLITLRLFTLKVKVDTPFLKLFKNLNVTLFTGSLTIPSPINAYGIAEFNDLPPGTYTVKVLNIEKTVTIRNNDRLVIITIPLSTTLRYLFSYYLIYILLVLLALAIVVIVVIKYSSKKALVLE